VTQTTERGQSAPGALDRAALAVAHRVVLVLLPLIVLVQAWLAGRRLGEGASITLHGILGNAGFLLAIAGVALAVVRRTSLGMRVAALAVVLAMFAQIGLGYSTRNHPDLVTWHVPLGVAIFGLATYQLGMLRRR
jgi:hypothetical protein